MEYIKQFLTYIKKIQVLPTKIARFLNLLDYEGNLSLTNFNYWLLSGLFTMCVLQGQVDGAIWATIAGLAASSVQYAYKKHLVDKNKDRIKANDQKANEEKIKELNKLLHESKVELHKKDRSIAEMKADSRTGVWRR